MSVFEQMNYADHEQIVFVNDRPSGLRAIIAIHDTTLGPAGGGIRMYPYDSSTSALNDVLRLSRAMTYKNALAGLPAGGGKSVIIGDPKIHKTEALLEAFGRAVETLGGRYIGAEDVGMTPADMAIINRQTDYVGGLPGKSGDTSPLTGLGVFKGIESAAQYQLGCTDLQGLTVALQGAGNVARHTCKHLVAAGAQVFVTDINSSAAEQLASDYGAIPVDVNEVLYMDVDVLAPCALGAVITDETIPRIRAKVVCGGANNQLAEERHGQALKERGILFVPDFVVNAGGAISGATEVFGKSPEQAMEQVERIGETCRQVFERAERNGVATNLAANAMAEELIADKRGAR